MVKENKKIKTTIRQRKAAYKAWSTVRDNIRTKASEHAEKIEKYLTLNQVSIIKHPEIPKTGIIEDVISYGKGIVILFHKAPADIACDRL